MTQRVVVLILLACVLLAPLVVGQVTPVLQLSTATTTVRLGPNETQEIQLTARNAGSTAGGVTLTAGSVKGWDIQVAERTFSLEAGASKSVKVTIRSGAHGADAPADGAFTVNGAISYPPNQQGTPGSTQIQLQYVAPAPIPVPAPPPSLVGPILGVIGGVALVAIGVYLFQAMGARLSVREPEQTVVQGTPATYEVIVENRFGSPRTIQLRVKRLGAPWAAAFSFPSIRLGGHEKTNVPLCVLPPLKATPGDLVQFLIQARPNRFSPWLVRRHIGSRVVVLPKPGPADAPEATAPVVA